MKDGGTAEKEARLLKSEKRKAEKSDLPQRQGKPGTRTLCDFEP